MSSRFIVRHQESDLVDATAIVFVRVWYYLIVAWEVYRYFKYDRVSRYYQETLFRFKYFGFEWVEPLPGNGMEWVFLALGFTAIAAAAGFLYRFSSFLTTVLLAYIFLLDQARYLNHIYLMVIISGLLTVLPLNRCIAVDARLGISSPSTQIGKWAYDLIKLQLIIVYLYAAIAKMNRDWLSGNPIGQWLQARSDITLVGDYIPLGYIFSQSWSGVVFAWGGLAVDLLVPFMLLSRRWRACGFVVSLMFHLLNSTIFNIGVFPWLMIGITTIFFAYDWPRRIFVLDSRATSDSDSKACARWLVMLLCVHFVVQLVVPLRHWLYPGDVAWTEEGHRFSWRMKLRDKDAGGYFLVVNPDSGSRYRVEATDYLSRSQARAMWPRPDMILQLAHHIADLESDTLGTRPEVYVIVRASLNHRAPRNLIDPTVDLSRIGRDIWSSDWITRK